METNHKLGHPSARTVETQCLHRLPSRRDDSNLARGFFGYKNVEDIFTLGEHLERTDYQLFRDLPLKLIKRRKEQMPTFKKARRNGMKVSFGKSKLIGYRH